MKISKIQEQFWLLNDLFPESCVYNIWEVIIIKGNLDAEILSRALDIIISRHDLLMSTFHFENDTIYQSIISEKKNKLSLSVIKYNKSISESVIPEEVSSELNTPFNLSDAIPFRIKLFQYKNNTSIFAVNFHHIITDVRSNNIFFRELSTLYNALKKNKAPELETIIYQYYDYINFFNEWSRSEEYSEKLLSWLEDYHDPGVLLELPTDYKRSSMISQEGTSKFFKISEEAVAKIEEFGEKISVNTFRIMLAVYAVLLNRLSSQDRVIIGVPLSNRTQPVSKNTFGCFVNTLPLEVNFENSPTFNEVLDQIKSGLRKNLSRQDIPLLDILNKSKKKRSANYNPYYQTGFTFRQPVNLDLEGLETEPIIHIVREGSQLDLFFILWQSGASIEGYAEYNIQLFNEKTIDRWIRIYSMLLDLCLKYPDTQVNELDILPLDDVESILSWNDTDKDYEDNICLHKKFEQQVKLTPEAIALRWSGGSFTYGELNVHSNRLAQYLISEGVLLGSIVSVCLDRSPELIISIFAILKSGAAYMPIDPQAPSERLGSILDDANPVMVLTTLTSEKNIPKGLYKCIHIDNIISDPLSSDDMDPMVEVNSKDLTYIIYTSGSTGKPKGVMIEHHSVLNRLGWMQEAYPLTESDVLLQKTPVTFDVSVWELFWWSLAGASLTLLSPGGEKEPETIIEYIDRYNISVIHFIPSMFGTFVNRLDSLNGMDRIKKLRNIFLSGEALPVGMVNEFNELMKGIGGASIINLYGPTEATVDVSYYNCPVGTDIDNIYIGKPISNTKLLVVNEKHKIQPIGIPGELLITGVNLSRGYINRDELNQEKFIEIEYLDGTKIKAYKTGDLVKWVESGELYFIGRIDNQVKIRGYRIELGDIEAKLMEYEGISNCVVEVNRRNPSNTQLLSYMVFRDEVKPTTKRIKDFLGKKLPEYMIPSQYMIIEEMPLTVSGKVNRKALPEPDIIREEEIVEPTSEIEEKLLDIWKEVLQIDNIGTKSNFFDVGGNSLLIPLIISKLEKKHDFKLRTVDILKFPNIKSLASYISQTYSSLQPAQTLPKEKQTFEKSYNQYEVIKSTDIAIIGMACRFPGAKNIKEFWDNLIHGRESITTFTDEELEKSEFDYNDLKNKSNYVRVGGVIEEIDRWDADFFGMTGQEAIYLDPQHRIWLELVWHAMEEAGCDPFTYNGKIGVFAGTSLNTYLLNNILNNRNICNSYTRLRTYEDYQIYLSNDPTFLPTRTSYLFNLKGPSMNIQTACSTSLVAVIQACNSLINGESDICLAGGVTISTPQETGYLYYEGGIKSPDGHTRSFDKDAKGMLVSNGAGVVVLKQLADAIKERNQIYSVIKGWAINNDGNVKVGYTAPSADGQAKVITDAQNMADIHPEDFNYIETHGTATPLGDPIEFEALSEVFRKKTDKKQYCAIGSVKSNVGHTDIAAGVCGLIKAALSTRHKIIPPSLNFKKANPNLNIEDSPFFVADNLIKKSDTKPLTIGVSSFGIGGTNAHVIIQEYIKKPELDVSKERSGPVILPISAKSEYSLEKLKKELIDQVNNSEFNLNDIAFTLQVGRNHMDKRAFAIGYPDVKLKNDDFVSERVYDFEKNIVFAFPGGGAQFVGMGKELYSKEPVFKENMDECFSIYNEICGKDLKQLIFGEKDDKNAENILKEIEYTQPALFCIEYSLAKLYMSYNVIPNYFIGHSTGDYIAACLAGVFDLETGLRIIIKRGELMQTMPPGNMMAVRTNEEQLIQLNSGLFDISAINAPEACTISFKPEKKEAIIEILERSEIDYIELSTNKAFHSADCDPFLDEFALFVDSFEKRSAKTLIISSYTGDLLTSSQAVSGEYWAQQSKGTVRFNQGINKLSEDIHIIFLEVGPSTHLSAMLLQNDNVKDKSIIISSIGKPEDESEYENFLKSIGKLWLKGIIPAFEKFHKESSSIVSLPPYPFKRNRYWIETDFSNASLDQRTNSQDKANIDSLIQIEESDEDLGKEKLIEPENELQARLVEIWKNHFGTQKIDITSNFYDIGGHSLMALQIINRYKEECNLSVSLKTFLQYPSIKQLTDNVEVPVFSKDKSLFKTESTNLNNIKLSLSQTRLWITMKMDPDNPAYNIPVTQLIKGPLNENIFSRSLSLLFKRHQIVFASFFEKDNEPIYRIDLNKKVELNNLDYSNIPLPDRRKAILNFIGSESRKPINIEKDDLYRLYLIKSADNEYYFHSIIHHIIFDGWSWSVFVKELSSIYNSIINDVDPDLKKLDYQYYDYISWQENNRRSSEIINSEKFWLNELKDVTPILEFPFDFPRGRTTSGKGKNEYIQLPDNISNKIRELSKEKNISIFTIIFTAYGLLMHKYSNQDDFCIGSPIANRPLSKVENIFGMFVNTVAVRFKFGDIRSFSDLLMYIKDVVLNAISNQNVPFERVVELIKPERSFSINPLFQITLAWQNVVSTNFNLKNCNVETVDIENDVAPFDLTLYMWEREKENIIEGRFSYNIDLLRAETVTSLKNNFITLLENVLKDINAPLSSLSLISVSEKKEILSLNSTSVPYPSEKTIIELFEDQVILYPDKKAISFKGESFSYFQLNTRVNQLAHTLRKKGIKREEPVGLLMEKSNELIIGILGILKAGGAYVPIDPDYPEERIKFMIEDCACSYLLLAGNKYLKRIDKVEHIDLHSKISYSKNNRNHEHTGSSSDLAYIMYTSGTTGHPKGSLIEQRSVVRLIRNTNYIDLTSEDKILLTGAIVFDATTFEIWGALLNGGTLFIPERETILKAESLGKALKENEITTLWLTSALFTHIAESDARVFSGLKYLLSGGDVLSAPHINKVRHTNPGLKVINGYGPTENTTFSTCYHIERDFEQNIPIGRPISNSRCYIFDANMNYQPKGVIGELYLAGDGLSRGYLNREDLDWEKFIEHPEIPGERLYRTGDRARWLPDGNIEFHGRVDNQLKVRGYRVELEEIENALNNIEGVIESAVKAIKVEEGDTRLVAFINLRKGNEIKTEEITQKVRTVLPSYMIPSLYKFTGEIPRTINGKINRKALKVELSEFEEVAEMEHGELTETQKKILEIWQDVLKTKAIGIKDNFFDVGGNSLLAINIVEKIEKVFNTDFNLRVFFDSPKIHSIAEHLVLKNISQSPKEIHKKKKKTKIIKGEV